MCHAHSMAQVSYEGAPIHYHTAAVDDAIADLAMRIESGESSLRWDEKTGWLKSLLVELKVPESSQALVFSKTSLQITKISASRPRAIYFSDDVYIGWVRNGGVIEASAVDPKLGPVFYSIPQTPDRFTIKRDKGECMSCHATSRTQNVPGYLVRSVFPDRDGTPFYGLGTTTTDQRTPMEKRFGGWYVTGTHGKMRHRGNMIADEKGDPVIDMAGGANRRTLAGLLNTDPYITSSSDMVALMVLEHQTQMHNYITRVNYESRLARHHDASMNQLLERADGYVSDSTRRRIASAGNKLIDYLLMKDALKLTSPIRGGSTFQEEFFAAGKENSLGRKLRELDLKDRLFKYPCSFLILSESYAGLPADVREYVEGRLGEILSGTDDSGEFDYITADEKRAIREILSESLEGFGKNQ